MKYQLNLNIAPYSNLIIDLDEVNLPEIQEKIRLAISLTQEKDRLTIVDSINKLMSERDYDFDKFMSYFGIKECVEIIGMPMEKLNEMQYLLKEKPLMKAGE